MQKNFLLIGCIFAALAVILGAFGAHGLKARLEPSQLQVFETGVKYQFYHAFAIIIAALLLDKFNNVWTIWGGYAFIGGIFLFSGSLYLLANRELMNIEHWKFLGPLTPLGGLLFIIGWGLLMAGILKK